MKIAYVDPSVKGNSVMTFFEYSVGFLKFIKKINLPSVRFSGFRDSLIKLRHNSDVLGSRVLINCVFHRELIYSICKETGFIPIRLNSKQTGYKYLRKNIKVLFLFLWKLGKKKSKTQNAINIMNEYINFLYPTNTHQNDKINFWSKKRPDMSGPKKLIPSEWSKMYVMSATRNNNDSVKSLKGRISYYCQKVFDKNQTIINQRAEIDSLNEKLQGLEKLQTFTPEVEGLYQHINEISNILHETETEKERLQELVNETRHPDVKISKSGFNKFCKRGPNNKDFDKLVSSIAMNNTLHSLGLKAETLSECFEISIPTSPSDIGNQMDLLKQRLLHKIDKEIEFESEIIGGANRCTGTIKMLKRVETNGKY